jgi:hypothetical protein
MGEARAKKAEELPDDTDDSPVCVVRKVKPQMARSADLQIGN